MISPHAAPSALLHYYALDYYGDMERVQAIIISSDGAQQRAFKPFSEDGK